MSRFQFSSRDPVFVFSDPGIDDALALAMASSSDEMKLIGACGVDGNVPSRLAAANVGGLFRLFGIRNVPVFQSTVDDPLHEYPISVHGKNGLGDVAIARPRSIDRRKVLSDYLKSQGHFQILSLGPLTAVAELLNKSPEIATQISQCIIMGGGFARGNVTPYAEFNVHSNPGAADEVFRSSLPKILVPLDVTEKVKLFPEDLGQLKRSKRKKVARVFVGMLQYYFNFEKNTSGFFGGYMHDPTAVLAITRPELFEFRRAAVRVDRSGAETRGRTIARFSRGSVVNTWIAVEVNAKSARSAIMKALIKVAN